MNLEMGKRLSEYRKNKNLSQEQLAQMLGVSRQAVSKWERAESSPDTDNLIMLSEIYGVTLDRLINGTIDRTADTGQPENNDKQNCAEKETADNRLQENKIDKANESNPAKGETGNLKVRSNKKSSGFIKKIEKFPYPVLCIVLYVIFGFYDILGGWGLAWILFFTIPLYYTFIEAVRKKDASEFVYPVLIIMIYLICGFGYSKWHPAWIIFLSIPVYYFIIDVIKSKN